MQDNVATAELIKKFYQLFVDLDQEQVLARLVQLVQSNDCISRVILCLKSHGHINVEAISQSRKQPITPNLNFRNLHNIPHKGISDSFDSGQPACADLLMERDQAHNALPGTRSFYIYPIVDRGQALAVYYLESQSGLDELEAAVQALEPMWMFSSFLLHHVMEVRHHRQRSREFDKAEQALWASDIYLNAILRHSPALISIRDLNGNVMLASDHYKHLAETVDDPQSFSAYPMEIAQSLWDSDFTESRTAQVVESELEVRHRDGTLHTYLMLQFPLRDSDEAIFSICSICTDITERKLAEDSVRDQQSRLNFMAFHDALTGLPNRSLFYDRLNHSLERAKRNKTKIGLMVMDVDFIKTINDEIGHDAGDYILKHIGNCVRTHLRKVDTVARLGGDEFVVILENISAVADVRIVANKILNRLAEPVNYEGHMIKSTATVGISVYPQDGMAADELLKRANIAMHKAKASGKNSYLYYTDGMDVGSGKFLVLEKDLQRAIEENQLCLYYQPQVDLQTGSLVGVEALVRWRHPQRGLISPSHFIPLAEESGLIIPLGEWLLRHAGAQQKTWLQQGQRVGKVAVNLSPLQLRNPDFVEDLGKILEEIDLAPQYLELEITESSAMEHAGETISMLTQLNQMGVSLAIDDFGTGYSSLAYLKRFPIQKLKIDRSFINDVHTDQNDASIAKSIIGLAHNMMLNVVAEGVENDEQANWLRKRGCDQAQGYLFSQPIPAEKLERFFENGIPSFGIQELELELPI